VLSAQIPPCEPLCLNNPSGTRLTQAAGSVPKFVAQSPIPSKSGQNAPQIELFVRTQTRLTNSKGPCKTTGEGGHFPARDSIHIPPFCLLCETLCSIASLPPAPLLDSTLTSSLLPRPCAGFTTLLTLLGSAGCLGCGFLYMLYVPSAIAMQARAAGDSEVGVNLKGREGLTCCKIHTQFPCRRVAAG
jgi:hypothetical protein